MMSALHLLWIIPLSVCFGYALAALMVIAGKDRENEEQKPGKGD